MTNKLFIFDFDKTIVDDDSDIWAVTNTLKIKFEEIPIELH